MLKLLLTIASLLLPLLAMAGELQVPLVGHRPLVLDLPPGWQAMVTHPRADLPPTVTIISSDPGAFQILLTPIWPMNGAAAPTSNEIRALVQRAASNVKPRAIEQDLPLIDLAASGKSGYFFSATDRAPEAGGYKFLTQGAIGMSELRITFTILLNGEPEQTRNQALEMLRSMRRSPSKNAA